MSDRTIISLEDFDRPTLVRWRNAIVAAFAVGGLALSTWGPRLPAIRADLNLGTGGLGVLLAGITVGSVTGLLVSTPILGWLGPRRALPAAMLLIAVAVTVVGVGAGALKSVPVVAVGFVVAGLAIGTLDVMINVEGAAIERAFGRTLMPFMHGAWSAGAAIGSGIGAGCAALNVSPAVQFSAEAALIVVIALVAAAAIPDGSRDVQVSAAERLPRAARFRGWLLGWTDLTLLLIGLVMLGAELGEGSANNWLTLAASDGHGRPAAIAALFFTAFAIGETTARVFGGPVVDRLGRVRTVRITSIVGIVGHLAVHPVRKPGGDADSSAAVGDRRLDGVPARYVCRRRERPEPGRPRQRGREHRLLRQPCRAARRRLPGPGDQPVECPVAGGRALRCCGRSSGCRAATNV